MAQTKLTTIRVPPRKRGSVLQMSGATLTVGSKILTPSGERLVEDLKPGDAVVSKDLGVKHVRYTAFQDLSLAKEKQLHPIKIIQPNGPVAYFAPDQHIAIRHPLFDMLFGVSEVLVRCSDLVGQPNIEVVDTLTSITYVALGFSTRHLLFCNGLTVEIGPGQTKSTRLTVSGEEAQLAWRLLFPPEPEAKRYGFPLQ